MGRRSSFFSLMFFKFVWQRRFLYFNNMKKSRSLRMAKNGAICDIALELAVPKRLFRNDLCFHRHDGSAFLLDDRAKKIFRRLFFRFTSSITSLAGYQAKVCKRNIQQSWLTLLRSNRSRSNNRTGEIHQRRFPHWASPLGSTDDD